MGKLEGKAVIITGAARGIGAAAARLFADEGAKLTLADVLAAPLQALAGQIGERAAVCPTDVTAGRAAMNWSRWACSHWMIMWQTTVQVSTAGFSVSAWARMPDPLAFDRG
jgi:NAD(P)-dependent dehydrogenase (short-subunit alcohol dehydrogenase family)